VEYVCIVSPLSLIMTISVGEEICSSLQITVHLNLYLESIFVLCLIPEVFSLNPSFMACIQKEANELYRTYRCEYANCGLQRASANVHCLSI
jgi:hypothetical protein